MKLLMFITFSFLTTFSFSQIQNIEYVDFYTWTGADKVSYKVIIVSEDFAEIEDAKSVVRVKYNLEGNSKIVEFISDVSYDINEGLVEIYFLGGETAKFIQNSGSYTPDNFVFTFDFEGNLIDAFQADHNELKKGDDTHFADMEAISVESSNHLRESIQEFFSSSDSLYRDLMTYASQFD